VGQKELRPRSTFDFRDAKSGMEIRRELRDGVQARTKPKKERFSVSVLRDRSE
jgi:hypothetical protein